MEFNKFVEKYFDENDTSGFNDVLYERQKHLFALKERLRKLDLSEEEIDKLFEIIVDAEIKIEKIKRSFKAKDYTEEELYGFRKKLSEIQWKMKDDFDSELEKILKEKPKKIENSDEQNQE